MHNVRNWESGFMSILPNFATAFWATTWKSCKDIRHLQQLYCIHFLPGRHSSRGTLLSCAQKLQSRRINKQQLCYFFSLGSFPPPLIKPEQRHVFWLSLSRQLLATDDQSANCFSFCGVPNIGFQAREVSMKYVVPFRHGFSIRYCNEELWVSLDWRNNSSGRK